MNKTLIIVSVILFVTLLTLSCSDVFNKDGYNIKSVELTPSEALPLAYGSLSIKDILSSQDSQYIKVAPDGLVFLEYDKTLRSQSLRDLITIKDKLNIGGTLPVPTSSPASASDVRLPPVTVSDQFDLSPQSLKEILLKAGTLSYTLSLSKPTTLNFVVEIKVQEFKDAAGNVLVLTTSGKNGTKDLAGYKYVSGTGNKISLTYTLIVKAHTGTVTSPPGTTVNASASFKSLDYKYVKGYFGKQQAQLNAETINIDAFGNSLVDNANISFAQPSVELQLINQVGVATQVTFDALEARKPGVAPLAVLPKSPVDIAFPTVMGDTAITNYVVSNSKELLDYAPKQFFYKASAVINRQDIPVENFITDTSELKVRMHIMVPLYGHASNIVLGDTVALDLSDADKSEITDASLKVKTANQIPLSANLQLYLTDEKYKILDSLLVPSQANLVKGSQVNAVGELATEGVVDEMIPLSKDVLMKLFIASKMIIKARINTSQSGNTFPDVKFKSSYKLDVKVGLKVNAKVKVDL